MNNRLQRVYKIKAVGALPEIIGKAAHCETTRTLIGWSPAGGGSSGGGRWVYEYVYTPPPPPGSPSYGDSFRPPTGTWTVVPKYWEPGTGGGDGGRQPIYRDSVNCTPEVLYRPAREASVVKSADNGWANGARSVKPLAVGSFMDVTVKDAPTAILIGLSPLSAALDYSAVPHGVVIRSGGVYEVALGKDLKVTPVNPKRVRISRYADRAVYKAGGVVVAERALSSSEELFVSVLLYSPSDFVYNPYFGAAQIPEGSADMRVESDVFRRQIGAATLKISSDAICLYDGILPVTGAAYFSVRTDCISESVTTSAGASRIDLLSECTGVVSAGVTRRLGKSALGFGGVSYAVSGLVIRGGASDSSFSRGLGFYPIPSLSAYMSRAEIEPTTAEGFFTVPGVYGYILGGGVSEASAAQSWKGKSAESSFFGGVIEVFQSPEIGGWFDEMAHGVFETYEPVALGGLLSLDAATMFSFIDGVGIGLELNAYLLLDVGFNELVMAEDFVSFSGLIELLISERLSVHPTGDTSRAEALQYAVNATTGAIGRYSNFGFTQFASTPDGTFAITPSGVYKVAAGSDNGDPISASIDFGADDFGTSNAKRISSVYAGIATDGGVYIRVAGDQTGEVVYKASNYGMESRAVTAKGVTARHWRIRLDVTDASYADLDNIEVELGVSNRRLTRGR